MNSKEYGHFIKKDNLYFHSPNTGKNHLIKCIDINKLELLSNDYACDGNNIIFEEKIIASKYIEYHDYQEYGYFKVDSSLYWYGKIVSNQFKNKNLNWVKYSFYTDGKNLIVNGNKLLCDINSLEVLNNHFAKDKNNVYCSENKVKKADAKTFQIIDEYSGIDKKTRAKYKLYDDTDYSACAFDKNNIYLLEKILIPNHRSSKKITLLNYPVFITGNCVYYFDKIIENADPNSYQPIFVKNTEYEENEIMRKIICFSGYYKDKNSFYFLKEHNTNENLDRITLLSDKLKLKLLKNKDMYQLNDEEISRLKNKT